MVDSGNGKPRSEEAQILSKNNGWGGDMPRINNFAADYNPLSDLVSQLSKVQRERIIAGYDLKNFARIFEDEATMSTVRSFFKNGMNVSQTARKLYMHRNTLIYRLKKIQNVTGLDLRDFDMAVTFEILRIMYGLK